MKVYTKRYLVQTADETDDISYLTSGPQRKTHPCLSFKHQKYKTHEPKILSEMKRMTSVVDVGVDQVGGRETLHVLR